MTKEYITKNRAKQFVCGHCNEVCSEEPCEPSDCDWMAFIDKEPAADVVEVVRCKDCKWYSELACGERELLGSQGWCNDVMELPLPSNGFCSFGERENNG